MGIFSVLTAPIRFGAHLVTGSIARTAQNAGAAISAQNAMNGVRLQLKSYEAKEMFDAKRLDKHFRLYHRARKRIMRYRASKIGGVLTSRQVHKIYDKFKNNPDLLMKAQSREVELFASYYQAFLQVVSAIELEESDLDLQKNACIMRNTKVMKAMLDELVRKADATDISPVQDDLAKVLDEMEAEAKKGIHEDRKEYVERVRVFKGARNVVKGWAGFAGAMTGAGKLSHKIRKLTKKVATTDARKFNEDFTSLRNDINTGRITPATLAKLRVLLKEYKVIRKYYDEIDQDIVLITGKLFEGFDEIVNDCVIPFYAALKGVPGSAEIIKINKGLQDLHQKYMIEVRKEAYEVKSVNDALLEFVHDCDTALGKITAKNKDLIQGLQKQMGVPK